jgi:hypothetical protein
MGDKDLNRNPADTAPLKSHQAIFEQEVQLAVLELKRPALGLFMSGRVDVGLAKWSIRTSAKITSTFNGNKSMKDSTSLIVFMLAIVAHHCAVADTLQTRVEVEQVGTNFLYTVFNDEPAGSNRHINIWELSVNAPFDVLSTPQGWDHVTDNRSYVTWFSTDSTEPFLHDIAPGALLEGFVLGAVISTSEELPYADPRKERCGAFHFQRSDGRRSQCAFFPGDICRLLQLGLR